VPHISLNSKMIKIGPQQRLLLGLLDITALRYLQFSNINLGSAPLKPGHYAGPLFTTQLHMRDCFGTLN